MNPSFTSVVTACICLVGSVVHADSTPKPLFNGKDFAGWELISEPKTEIGSVCHIRDGGVIAVDGKPAGYIQMAGTYENYKLHAEWRWTSEKPSNSGFLVHIITGPKDRIWPECFQIQTKQKFAGDIIPMADAKCSEFSPATQKQVDKTQPVSEKPTGEWNTCDIICRGDMIECSINGVVQNKVTHCAPQAGQIGVQLEGTSYELRNMTLTQLDK